MIFTRYSLQFERALKNLTPNTERATKKQNAFWAGFRKKEESYYFFPDPVILKNNEPSLSKGTSYQELTVAKNPYLTITFFISVPECRINDTYNIYIFLLTSLN